MCVHCRHVEELKIAHRQQQEELQLRYKAELHSKEERWEAQRLTWEESLLRSQETEMMAKERELITRLREERDKVCPNSRAGQCGVISMFASQEIEMVISRLESETASAKEESERAAEARVRCVEM